MSGASGLGGASSGFGSAFTAPKTDPTAALAKETQGLVSKEEFTKRREELEKREEKKEAEGSGEAKKKKKKKKAAVGSALSFGDDEEPDCDEPPKKKLGKNPSVDSSFLPDKERDEADAKRREVLAEEYRKQVELAKAEMVEVTYSYHDPGGRDGFKGHRYSVQIPKGYSVQEFLNKCREQCVALRSCSADQLMYVKEDLILPQGLTFYELIVNKARGKSGCAAGGHKPRLLLLVCVQPCTTPSSARVPPPPPPPPTPPTAPSMRKSVGCRRGGGLRCLSPRARCARLRPRAQTIVPLRRARRRAGGRVRPPRREG